MPPGKEILDEVRGLLRWFQNVSFIIIHPYPSFKKLKDGSIIFLFIKYKHWTQVLFVAIQTASTSSSVT